MNKNTQINIVVSYSNFYYNLRLTATMQKVTTNLTE